jgi:hypothetical protein
MKKSQETSNWMRFKRKNITIRNAIPTDCTFRQEWEFTRCFISPCYKRRITKKHRSRRHDRVWSGANTGKTDQKRNNWVSDQVLNELIEIVWAWSYLNDSVMLMISLMPWWLRCLVDVIMSSCLDDPHTEILFPFDSQTSVLLPNLVLLLSRI